ncbi:MAG: protein kinase [Verrucomicrobiales bacterium]|nr:protein kinase [Verrucomicrobiales bacterium]
MSGPLTVGFVVGGRYEIKRYVDAGGMQFVYAANDSITDRLVALKTPKNQSATKRFKRSAVVAAKVNHPNVAKTLDYVKEGDARYLIEEFIEGADMAKALLQKTRFLDPYLCAKVFHHLSKGVSAAHHAGVVHRDLKPTNVMVVGGYSLSEVKVTDFGIAKMADEELKEAAAGGTATMTTSQTAVGALPYMAPEAIETPTEVGAKADIWSLGAMMFHLLSGEAPFGMGLRAVSAILAAETPTAPAFLTSNPQFAPLSRQVMELALSCLKRDPDERPSADQLVAACGDLCYTSTLRREGWIKRIDYGKYGFIRTAEEDVFFHMESVYGPDRLQVDDHVLFSSFDGGGADRAHPVLKLR